MSVLVTALYTPKKLGTDSAHLSYWLDFSYHQLFGRLIYGLKRVCQIREKEKISRYIFSTHPLKQWAAVTTQRGDTSDPPHVC